MGWRRPSKLRSDPSPPERDSEYSCSHYQHAADNSEEAIEAPIGPAVEHIQTQQSSSGPSISNRASCSGLTFIVLFRLFNFGAEFLNLGFAFLFQPNQLISSLPVGFD